MSGYVAPDTLVALGVSQALANQYAPFFTACFEAYDLTTDNRKAAFLARACGPETNNLRWMRELGKFSGDRETYKGRGVMQLTWLDAYTQYTAYVRQNYASIVQRYRGLVSLPATPPNFVSNPQLIESLPWSVDSAGWFWRHYKAYLNFNALADAGRFDAISRGINGGTNGLTEYRNVLAVARRILPQQATPVPAQPAIATMQGPVVLPPINTLPPITTAGVNTSILGDLAKIFLPGTSTPGAGGSWLAGQTSSGAFSLDVDKGSPTSSSDSDYDLVARLQKIKAEHVLALLGVSFLLIKPDMKSRKELLR